MIRLDTNPMCPSPVDGPGSGRVVAVEASEMEWLGMAGAVIGCLMDKTC